MWYFQSGLTFLEIIISLLLISISFLGFVRLDILSLQAHNMAYQTSIASAQVFSMKNRLKANHGQSMKEFSLWNKQNQELLPEGRGELECAGEGCHIHLSWYSQGEKKISAFIRKESQ